MLLFGLDYKKMRASAKFPLRKFLNFSIFQPPDQNVSEFVASMRNILTIVTEENKICYVMGDFNLELLRHEQHSFTVEFVELMFSHLFYPLIPKRQTRLTSNTASLNDNIFTNNITSCLKLD